MKINQDDYNEIIDALDSAMLVLDMAGMTEAESRVALMDFIEVHYFPVWRGKKSKL